ncbi:serpin family protein [Streptomyces sp. NPDC058052]|uniref:serpin family protein n=1 Tax=Streptomyces sp. NPDC058052 TaxID=3346316 RepID=UPI0036E2103A
MTGTSAAVRAGVVRELAALWLAALGEGDHVCSPVGLWTALGAVASGARGRTARELGEVLGVPAGEAAEAVNALGGAVAGTGGVGAAVGVWSRVPVREGFRAGLPGVRFGELGAAAQGELDAWAREATGGLVPGLPEQLDGGADLVLVGALALRAAWRTAFDPALTRPADFTDGAGKTRPVPTMHGRVPASWAWRTGGGVVLELPCAGERGARVRFVLGEPGARPWEVVPLAWAGDREPVRAAHVEAALPRFSLRSRIDVRPWLASAGAGGALRPGADFSGLSPEAMFVSRVAQEAVVEVAEEGVEAAAVTQVVMTRSAVRPLPAERIAFDRPFGVAVMDAGGELPLFVGWRAGGAG